MSNRFDNLQRSTTGEQFPGGETTANNFYSLRNSQLNRKTADIDCRKKAQRLSRQNATFGDLFEILIVIDLSQLTDLFLLWIYLASLDIPSYLIAIHSVGELIGLSFVTSQESLIHRFCITSGTQGFQTESEWDQPS
jgi:hypothetical protein